MARPLRLEFSGAIYHITSRGDRREDIYLKDEDRVDWLDILANVCERFNWVIHAYCQMTNHYHILVETVDGNLSRGMRQLNGVYTQHFNRRHGLNGHLYQGRYKAILVDRDSYLLELTRYVVLNPLRAGMVNQVEEWPWSSYRSVISCDNSPSWLDTDWLLSQFGKHSKVAMKNYQQFVYQGINNSSPLENVRHQLLLGSDDFVEKYHGDSNNQELREISKSQRKVLALSLAEYQKRYNDPKEAMARAYLSSAYTMVEIGEYFHVHYRTVSRAVRGFEKHQQGLS